LEGEGELTRLLEISARLSELNEQLKNELEGSRKSSSELLNMLEASKRELEELRKELTPLRKDSTELLSRAEISGQELNELRTALRKAESSLTSLDASYGAYRMAAEARITRLERSGRWYKYAVIAAAVLAAGGWTAFAVAR
jgi:chromosome segregation ATPase